MKRLIAVLALAGALAGSLSGCEHETYGSLAPSPPPPMSPPPRHEPIDACGAGSLQYLVGRPVSEAPQSYNSRHSRRLISQSSYYEDRFDPERLTIVYDDRSNLVTRVRCG